MPDYTPHQRRIIDGYYANRDDIMLTKLAELVSDLFLAATEKKRDQLWKRVAAAMKNLKVPPAIQEHILEKRSPELLASHLKDWSARRP